MKDKLTTMSEDDALNMLTENGNLVKRPFLTGEYISLVGFKENDWSETFKS
jgi:arsenate reductase-like glutaredoxin family protein